MTNFNVLDWIAFILVIVGALNWGLIGLFGVNLVSLLLGDATLFTRLVYILVGLGAVYFIYTASKSS